MADPTDANTLFRKEMPARTITPHTSLPLRDGAIILFTKYELTYNKDECLEMAGSIFPMHP